MTNNSIPVRSLQLSIFAATIALGIHSLSARPTYDPSIQQGFAGEVVNAGVTYCSSAANNWGTDGYA